MQTADTASATVTVGEYPVARAIRLFYHDFVQRYRPSGRVRSVLEKIMHCRTGFYGGRLLECSACGYQRRVFNFPINRDKLCGDRHCPTCQSIKKELWIDKRRLQMLDVRHFHVIFTVPHQLNLLFLHFPQALYTLLFQAANRSVQAVGRPFSPQGRMGMIAALHTWGSNMSLHPHLHCIPTAGSYEVRKKEWTHAPGRGKFLVRGRFLADTFRRHFLNGLADLWQDGEIDFGIDPETGEVRAAEPVQELSDLADPDDFRRYLRQLQKMRWNVRIEAPMHSTEHVVKYLARYVYRIAITNGRIQEVSDKTVKFEYKQYAATREGGEVPCSVMELAGVEFLRRFSQHILPGGFQRIRYYGLYAPAARQHLKEAEKATGCYHFGQALRTVTAIITEFLGGCHPDTCPVCQVRQHWLVTEIPPDNPRSRRHRRRTESRGPPAHQLVLGIAQAAEA